MQLIDRLGRQESEAPGRVLRIFKFQGLCWEESETAHNGKSFLTPSEERQSILILAQTAWMAHTFLKVHLPAMRPDKILCLGKVWLAPNIEAENWIPREYEKEEPGE
jgi:hypothetical protein